MMIAKPARQLTHSCGRDSMILMQCFGLALILQLLMLCSNRSNSICFQCSLSSNSSDDSESMLLCLLQLLYSNRLVKYVIPAICFAVDSYAGNFSNMDWFCIFSDNGTYLEFQQENTT